MADDIEDLLREVEEKYLPAEKEPAVKKIENLCISGRSNSDIMWVFQKLFTWILFYYAITHEFFIIRSF